jgi:lipid II:glycine glycyltransferase (peptidoglycan interpeptide bridge formation enzyme)
MVTFKDINDQKKWDKLVEEMAPNSFLQAYFWGTCNASETTTIYRKAMEVEGKILSVCQYFVVNARRGKYLLVPHGPVFAKTKETVLDEWVQFFKKEGKAHKVDFIRLAPMVEDTAPNQHRYSRLGFRKSPIHMFAELTSIVDLTASERDIQLGMRKTVRQMIKKAQKLVDSGDITITYPSTLQDDMYKVFQSTAQRGGFVPVSRKFLQSEVDSCLKNNHGKAIAIYYKGELVSWGLVVLYANKAYYHQGGNILMKNVPSAYLLHWLGMVEAKKAGCDTYDFWGVGPKGQESHPWNTISQFKRGFGGDDYQRMHALDMPLRLKYRITWIIERIRSIRRGFG